MPQVQKNRLHNFDRILELVHGGSSHHYGKLEGLKDTQHYSWADRKQCQKDKLRQGWIHPWGAY